MAYRLPMYAVLVDIFSVFLANEARETGDKLEPGDIELSTEYSLLKTVSFEIQRPSTRS